MAVFNFNGVSVDSSDPDFAAKAEQAIIASGGSVAGSIVSGNVYGVSGGTVTGDVYGTDELDD